MIHDLDPALSQSGHHLVREMGPGIVMQNLESLLAIMVIQLPEHGPLLPHSCAQLGQDLAVQLSVDGAVSEVHHQNPHTVKEHCQKQFLHCPSPHGFHWALPTFLHPLCRCLFCVWVIQKTPTFITSNHLTQEESVPVQKSQVLPGNVKSGLHLGISGMGMNFAASFLTFSSSLRMWWIVP